MNTREVGAKLYCYIYFISLVWMRFCRTFLPLSCLGCLAKQGSKEKTLLPISDIVKLHVMHLPVSGSSTELLSKKLREHQSLAFTPLVPGWEPLRGVKKKKKAAKLCEVGEFVFLPLQRFGQRVYFFPVHLCWVVLQREKQTNFSFFATISVAPYLLVPCVNIAKHRKVLKFFSPVCTIIYLEMSRIQALAAFLVNTCF